MARTKGVVGQGLRLPAGLSIGILTRVFPLRSVAAALEECRRSSRRRRALPAESVVYFVIALGLFRAVSSTEVLRAVRDGLRWASAGGPPRIPTNAAVSQARSRLGTEPFRALRRLAVKSLAADGSGQSGYKGLRLAAYEGAMLRLPDEPRNRKRFGQGEASTPTARVTALVETATRAPLQWEYGPSRESAREQAQRLHRHLQPGMLLLAEPRYLEESAWGTAAATGAELLLPVPRRVRLPARRWHDDGSFLSELAGGSVRVVPCAVCEPGESPCRLATTLLDPAHAPADELATLYRRHLEDRAAGDEINRHLFNGGAIVRAKTPLLVRQEIEGLMLANYALRHFLHGTAQANSDAHDPCGPGAPATVAERRPAAPG